MDTLDPSEIDFSFNGSLADAVNLGVALAILIGGLVSVFYIFYGGMLFITSGGDEERSKKAVNTIRYAIIGLIVIIFAVTIIAIIGSIFDFNLTEMIQWDKMKFIMQNIIEKFTGNNSIGRFEQSQQTIGGIGEGANKFSENNGFKIELGAEVIEK